MTIYFPGILILVASNNKKVNKIMKNLLEINYLKLLYAYSSANGLCPGYPAY